MPKSVFQIFLIRRYIRNEESNRFTRILFYCKHFVNISRLTYTSAFLSEVHRYCTIAPFAGGRRVLADVEIDGYIIPSGTTVLVSLGDLHRDPNYWEEPDKFKPERFIDNNAAIINSANLHPFGLGTLFLLLYQYFYLNMK